MNPIMSSETVRIVHDSMRADQLARQRQIPSAGLRHRVAALLVALGDRLDPSVRRPASQVGALPRLGAA